MNLHRGTTVVRRFMLLGLLLAMIVLLPEYPAICTDRPTLHQPHFKILEADRVLEKRIDSILAVTHAELIEFGEMPIPDTITVLVAHRREQFDSVVGGHFPDWGAGCALPTKQTVVILNPHLFPMQIRLVEVLRHELAHIYLHQLVGGVRIPRWMDEGFAMLVGHQWVYGDDWLVARAVFSRETLPLAHIEGLNRYREGKARLSYAQSYLAMKYLLETYGWESFLFFLRETRESNDWNVAFMKAIGLDYAGFQAEFTTYLGEKYNWASLFSDTVLMWILLVLLLVVLYLFKRRRAKKIVDQWERTSPPNDIFYSAREQRRDDKDQS